MKLVASLPKTPVGRRIGDQLLRSGTSVGANYEEAQGAESKADFTHKLQIALKELRESRYAFALARGVSNNPAASTRGDHRRGDPAPRHPLEGGRNSKRTAPKAVTLRLSGSVLLPFAFWFLPFALKVRTTSSHGLRAICCYEWLCSPLGSLWFRLRRVGPPKGDSSRQVHAEASAGYAARGRSDGRWAETRL